MKPVNEAFTPDDLTPEQLERRNFKKSPLARRISDDILRNPITTKELLSQKKTQFKQLIKDKDMLKRRISETYLSETVSDPFHGVRMPMIRVFPSKTKTLPQQFLEESSFSDLTLLEFPNISEVFWNKIDIQGWKPETRQQATLTAVQNKFYLIGGVSRSINSEVNSFFSSYKRWEKISATGVEAEPRFGHSTVEYRKKLYVFGGGTDFNSIHKLRECLNGVKSFNTETNEWANVKCEGSYITTRKHHCAGILGKHMYIHGGLNQKNNPLNDSAALNLDKGRWKSLSTRGPGPSYLSFHTAVVVLNPEQRTGPSLYKMTRSKNAVVKVPGIYVFGGINEERIAQNTLYVLQTGSRPLNWLVPETSGQAPGPRFQHSMTYNEKLNIVIVFGGRVDVNSAVHYTCFNELFVLKMDCLLWTSVRMLGNVPAPRSGHCCASLGSKVYLFAGAGTVTYCTSDMYMLELSPKAAKVMIEDEEKRKAREIEIEVFRARRSGVSQEERIRGMPLDLEYGIIF